MVLKYNFFNKLIPSDAWIRPYAKMIGTDLNTLLGMFKRREDLEKMLPKGLVIEPTNLCNADCIFCAYRYQNNFRTGRGFMSQEIFERALHDYQELGGYKCIYLSALSGDPLFDPDIIKKAGQAKKEGFSVTLCTNGILLNKIDLGALVKSDLDSIDISTGPFEENSYRLIFRTSQYKDMLAGLIKLLEIRNSLNSRTRVSIQFRSHLSCKKLVRLADYREKIFPLLRDEERKAIYPCIKSFDTWGKQIQKKDLIGIMAFAKAPLLKTRPCQWSCFLMVLYDGKVRGCPCSFTRIARPDARDELSLGDLKNSSLKEIWSSQARKDLHRRFITGNLPEVCQSCTLYKAV